MHGISEHVPTTLLRLAREAEGVRQTELATRLGVSTSVLSRVEGSETADGKMAERYLSALRGPMAGEMRTFFSQGWRHIDRPDFRHPERGTMWNAERCLRRLDEFERSEGFDVILLGPINSLRQRIGAEIEFIRRTEHGIAFIGEIGVGKTTALSFVTDLLVRDGDQRTSVFPTGSGRTTVCEVAIKMASAYGIAVECMGEEAVRLLVADLVNGIATGKGGLPSELDRVIRNLAGLRRIPVRSREPGGKATTVDQLKDLIDEIGDVDAGIAEVVSRMKLETRTGTQMILSADAGDSMDWLRSNIGRINYGQHPDFSVPERITVLLPLDALRRTPYALTVVDTKGVEGTTQRADLMAQLEDERTVTVLCSSFPDAPGTVPLSIVRDAVEAGSDAISADRACLLVLPRSDEATRTVDDSGARATSDEEGYAIREAQIEQQFATDGLPSLATTFFHVGRDSAQEVWDWLIDRVAGIRRGKIARIERHVAAAEQLIGAPDVVKAREARIAIAAAMDKALDRFEALPAIVRPAYVNLVAEVKKTHQSSVAASVSRLGDWPQFPAAHILGQGVRRDVNLRTRDLFVRLNEAVSGLEDDFGHIPSAAQFLANLNEDVEEARRELLSRTALAGRMLYAPHLASHAGGLWHACRVRYGAGSGYRVDVSGEFEKHFSTEAGARDTGSKVEAQVQALWSQLVIQRLREASFFDQSL